MYLSGSKWNMNKRKRHSNPWRVIVLLCLVGGFVYLNEIVVPKTEPWFIPTPTATRSPDSFINEAESFLAEGKIQPAIESYQNAILADPKNVSNYIKVARLLTYTGNYEEAATQAENALLLNPNNSMALAIRGWAIGLSGDYLTAVESLKNAVKYDPNNGTAYAYYAEILALQQESGQDTIGTLDQAIEYSQLAVEKSPGTMETHRARGLVLELPPTTLKQPSNLRQPLLKMVTLPIYIWRWAGTTASWNGMMTQYLNSSAQMPSTPTTICPSTTFLGPTLPSVTS
jgi:tetratricopeptide (TPR) repeat protein